MNEATTPDDVRPVRRARRKPSGELAGLTGLRAIAVVAVVAYHLGHLRGGFVGVDMFFVLSGFLITTLLLKEPPADGHSMLRWWGRRVRRLTPAAAVVVLAVLAAFLTTSGVAMDALATLTWWQNWHLIAEGTSYWAPAPSPLRHAWSLSIEEQFYILWPPTLVALLALTRRSRRQLSLVAGAAFTLSVASFAWAAWLSGRAEDLSRVYFGTDTRGGALLLGCGAAALLSGSRRPTVNGTVFRAAPKLFGRTAPVAAAVLVVLALTMSPEQRWTYTGGLLLAAIASLVLVLSTTRSKWLDSFAQATAVNWVGTRSYAIYLWSWPIQVFIETTAPDLGSPLTSLITVVATGVLSEASMRLVERPLRFSSAWAKGLAPRRAAWGVGSVVIIALMVLSASSAKPSVDEVVAAEFERLPDPTTTAVTPVPDVTSSDDTTPASTAPPTTCVQSADPNAPAFTGQTGSFDESTVAAGADPTATQRCGSVTRVLVLGDSTARGTANGLRRLAAPDLEVWDRSELGCGFVVGRSDCPDWEPLWTDAVNTVDPDVVIVIVGVSDDIGTDGEFLDEATAAARRAELERSISLLEANGATVYWNLPPNPLGTFYCGGRTQNSGCDPVWGDHWRNDVLVAANESGAKLLDVNQWVIDRGTVPSDRPDGAHLSGPALDEQANWIAQQLRQR